MRSLRLRGSLSQTNILQSFQFNVSRSQLIHAIWISSSWFQDPIFLKVNMAKNAYCGLALFALVSLIRLISLPFLIIWYYIYFYDQVILVVSYGVTWNRSCYRTDYDEMQVYRIVGMVAVGFLSIVGIADWMAKLNFIRNYIIQVLVSSSWAFLFFIPWSWP